MNTKPKLGDIIENDPITGLKVVVDDVGPRGAIYRWAVLDQDGNRKHDYPTRAQAHAFVHGYTVAVLDHRER